ncbi:hypothetical protein HMPREF0454_04482 [Hafnia alvei ATCC 51873]|uniref:Uncharacterized protein n=1 Tax=Hafnia alvei ATCC 51873 TaxID=1002364 RepID=G9YCY8_HAFAL|nr:hypothetical protein HMPREF0454_04482 [Hafnia alvei ATCC 51873]
MVISKVCRKVVDLLITTLYQHAPKTKNGEGFPSPFTHLEMMY